MHPSRQRKDTRTMKTDCKFKAVARHDPSVGWSLKVLDNNHNHGPVTALSALPQYRIAAMSDEEHAKVKQMNAENHTPKQILTLLQNANPELMLIP
jgi:hypothetical protein